MNDAPQDWFADFLHDQTRLIIIETVEVPDPAKPGETLSIDIESVNAISWARLFRLMDTNNIKRSTKYKWELTLLKGKVRGRVAMNMYNALRGAARRRGGLYGFTTMNKREWHAAPEDWLKVNIEYDYTQPREDQEGKTIRRRFVRK